MEVFRAVMVSGGVNSAAELLHVSPPAVSKTLAQAQRASSFQLFERVKGRLVATPEAQQLLVEVNKLWRAVDNVRDASRELGQPLRPSLRLVVTASLAPALVSRTVTLLYAQIPRLQCRLQVVAPDLLSASLLEGSADLGIALLPHAHPSLVNVRSYQCGLSCVMRDDHPLARKKLIGPADLIGHRVISSPPGTPFGQTLRRAFGRDMPDMHCDMEVTSSTTACWFAQAGAGVAVVDQVAIAGGVLAGLAVRPFKSKERMAVQVMRNRYRPSSVTQNTLVALFDQVWAALVHGSDSPPAQMTWRRLPASCHLEISVGTHGERAAKPGEALALAAAEGRCAWVDAHDRLAARPGLQGRIAADPLVFGRPDSRQGLGRPLLS